MSELSKFREQAFTVLQSLDKLILKEMHSDRIKTVIEQDAKKLEQINNDIKAAQDTLEVVRADKASVLLSLKKESEDILHNAKLIEKKAQEHLEEAKRRDSFAQDALEQAEKARLSHQTALNEVLAQKEKIRIVLG